MKAHHFLLGLLWLYAPPAAVKATDPAKAATSLEFRAAWIRAAPPSSPVMAGYVTLVNPSRRQLTILRAESPAFGTVEMHEMRTVDGVMRMRPLAQLRIDPETRVALAPGATHLMLMRPVRQLQVGEHAEITFVLDDGTHRTIDFEVRPASAGAN